MTDHPRTGFGEHIGIRVIRADKEKVVGEIDADARHVNGRGIVHGGAMMAFADDLGGLAASFHKTPGTYTSTIELKTNFFRACAPGTLTAETVPLHTGRRSIVVQTTIFTPDGKRAAMVTQTQLVLPRE